MGLLPNMYGTNFRNLYLKCMELLPNMYGTIT